MGRVPLGFAGLDAPQGSHIAFASESEINRQDSLFGFISAGLRNDEKCIAAVSEYTPDFWTNGLRAHGIEPEAIPYGQLDILTAGRLFNAPISESIRMLPDMLSKYIEDSFNNGWQSVRVCASFTHLYHHKQTLKDLLLADSKINDLTGDRPITFLCAFNKSKLHPLLLKTSLKCHRLVTDGTFLNGNDDYLEPDQLDDCLPDLMEELDKAGALKPPFTVLDFHGDIPIISTGDELDFCTTPGFEELASWIVSVNHKELVVDLSGTSFMDAGSISALLRIARALEDRGGRLAIYDPLNPTRRIFQIVKLHDYIPVRRSLDEAVEMVVGRDPKTGV